jgi:hypothetical protein
MVPSPVRDKNDDSVADPPVPHRAQVLGPFAAGIAAWMASREARRQMTDLGRAGLVAGAAAVTLRGALDRD